MVPFVLVLIIFTSVCNAAVVQHGSRNGKPLLFDGEGREETLPAAHDHRDTLPEALKLLGDYYCRWLRELILRIPNEGHVLSYILPLKLPDSCSNVSNLKSFN